MDDLVPVGEQLEQLGRFRDELQRHPKYERKLERPRHVGLAGPADKQRHKRDDKAFGRHQRTITVAAGDLVSGRGKQSQPQKPTFPVHCDRASMQVACPVGDEPAHPLSMDEMDEMMRS